MSKTITSEIDAPVETNEAIEDQKLTRLAKMKLIATSPMAIIGAVGVVLPVTIAIIASRRNSSSEETTDDVNTPTEA